MGRPDTVSPALGWSTVQTWGRMVKFSHSVFALPFALSGALLAGARHGITWSQAAWVAVAMIAARNAAMGFNRLADHAIDAKNPRTAGRELPRGVLSRRAVWAFTLVLSAVFVAASFALNPLCLALSPVALAIIFGYSYAKRFTWGSHLLLGVALGTAPVGGWLAVCGRWDPLPWMLAAAVIFWVAGFDTIYACQDESFDRSNELHSIPSRFGIPRALLLARVAHGLALVAMVWVGLAGGLHPVYYVFVAAIAATLVWEHRVVGKGDLTRIGVAFLNGNAIISVLYVAGVLAATFLGRPNALFR